MNIPDRDRPSQGADRDSTSEALAKEVPAEQSDDLFTDRGSVNVSSPHDDYDGENKVATSLEDAP